MKTTQSEYSLVIGGYRVRFTNWSAGDRETFFQSKSDAQDYVKKFEPFGYIGVIEEIEFNVKEAN
jgi:hypothetical protein